MAEWSARRSRNPATPEFESCSGNLQDLPPASWRFNPVMLYLNYLSGVSVN